MNQPQHRSPWRRLVALSALLSLLFFAAVSASHVHSTTTSGGVRQECQLCAAGKISPSLTFGTLLFAALVLVFFLAAASQAQPCLARRRHPGDPRSPPALS